jgi:hypothetical protein
MSANPDRLFDLLPLIYRQRDGAQGWPLRALLRVIGEQVDVVENNIQQLYDNWFIETCEEWVVPYIGELIGYVPTPEAGQPGPESSGEGRRLNRVLVPRADVADTIRHRRRKGTIALLEELARDVAGWPARAVEFYRLLALDEHLNHLNLTRGRTADMRNGHALDRVGGPFDECARTVDIRRIASSLTRGRYNIPSVGVFVWRLGVFPVTGMSAYCAEDAGANCFTFSALGNDTPLFTNPRLRGSAPYLKSRLDVPAAITRRELARDLTDYYGEDKSFWIRVGPSGDPVPADRIVVADLDGWIYRPKPNTVAVDPERGRIAFPTRLPPREGVTVTYSYGFSDAMGAGEYERPLSRVSGSKVFRVGREAPYRQINDAIAAWRQDAPDRAVIQVEDRDEYVEPLNFELGKNQFLELRAAEHVRPILRLLDFRGDRPDALTVVGDVGSRFSLDGFLLTGRGIELRGNVARFTMRHSTLVPGWGLRHDCEPTRPTEPSLTVESPVICVEIEHSILGTIQVNLNEVRDDPIRICLSDSILDATSQDREALGAQNCALAHAVLTLLRTTVIGQIQTHAIALAENSILAGRVFVARRQIGCLRFCWVEADSRTPRRFECQPDLVRAAVPDAATQDRETARVRPRFNSQRYGSPTYCQLSDDCAAEIVRGGDDESEMGVFHDLFQPQREANLISRLNEYTPAGMEAGLIRAS